MLRDKLSDAQKDAMRSKDRKRLSTIRLILAAIKEHDIAMRGKPESDKDDDVLIMEILSKMVKQRNESADVYEKGGREELAAQERLEITIIEEFLPQQLTEEEIGSAVADVIESLGAEGLKDIGRCMAALKERYAGRMDFSKASKMVKDRLS